MFRRRRVCKFCVEKIDVISYKDVRLLSAFIPERGSSSRAGCRAPARRTSGSSRRPSPARASSR